MAAKEIKDWLDTLDTMKQGFDDVSKYKKEASDKSVRDKYLTDLPGQLTASGATPEESKLISGQEQVTPGFAGKYLLENLQNKQKQKLNTPYTMTKLAPYKGQIPNTALQTIANQQDRASQDKALEFYGQRVAAGEKREMFDSSQGRLTKNEKYVKPFETFRKDLANETKLLDSEANSLVKAQSLLAMGKLPADSAVVNYMARQVGGEKGPLSDQDRAAFLARSLNGTETQMLNFLTSGDETKLTDDQRATYKSMLKTTAANIDKFRGQRVNQRLTEFQASHPEFSVDEAGGLEKGFAGVAKSYGHSFKDGSFVREGIKKEYTGDYGKVIDGAKKAGRQDIIDRVMKAADNPAGPEALPPEYLQKFGGQ